MTTSRKLLEEVIALAGDDEKFAPLVLRIRAHLSQPTARSPRFTKPTPQEVTSYARDIGFKLDGQAFCDFYESKGWKVGKTPMKCWRAAVRTWKRSSNQQSSSGFGY